MATFRKTQTAKNSPTEKTAPAKPAPAPAKVQAVPTQPTAAPISGASLSHERIAARAYEIWQASGCPTGHDREDWLQAERELRGR